MGTRPPRRPSSSDRVAVDVDLARAARRVVEGALSFVPGACVVVVADEVRREACVALALVEVARACGATAGRSKRGGSSWMTCSESDVDLDGSARMRKRRDLVT